MTMHDWTLISIDVNWKAGTACLRVNGPQHEDSIVVQGLRNVAAPRLQPWGPSHSINKVSGPHARDGGSELLIEMQSGDIIRLVAEHFEMPAPQS